MPRTLKWIIAATVVVLVALGGATASSWLAAREPQGYLDTALAGVTVTEGRASTSPPAGRRARADRDCWPTFGGNSRRSLTRSYVALGLPARKPMWSIGLKSYIEFPPAYCNGTLYLNTFEGKTFAVASETGRIRWQRRLGGTMPSSPAIDARRVIVSSQDGTVTALDRRTGRTLWRLKTGGGVESSPVIVDGLVFFGSHDQRLFAVHASTGRVRWAFDTGGRINASPSVFDGRVCVTTYAGSVLCVRRRTGRELWTTYIRRDALRYESFYASPSTDGRRLFSVARSGKVVALDAGTGRVLWTNRVGGPGYTTPAVANGVVYVGGLDGYLHAFDAATGVELWKSFAGGRVLGAPVVIGRHVFFSTKEGRTFGARTSDGRIVWRLPFGRYSPGIATESAYYFTVNGRLMAFRGRAGAQRAARTRQPSTSPLG